MVPWEKYHKIDVLTEVHFPKEIFTEENVIEEDSSIDHLVSSYTVYIASYICTHNTPTRT